MPSTQHPFDDAEVFEFNVKSLAFDAVVCAVLITFLTISYHQAAFLIRSGMYRAALVVGSPAILLVLYHSLVMLRPYPLLQGIDIPTEHELRIVYVWWPIMGNLAVVLLARWERMGRIRLHVWEVVLTMPLSVALCAWLWRFTSREVPMNPIANYAPLPQGLGIASLSLSHSVFVSRMMGVRFRSCLHVSVTLAALICSTCLITFLATALILGGCTYWLPIVLDTPWSWCVMAAFCVLLLVPHPIACFGFRNRAHFSFYCLFSLAMLLAVLSMSLLHRPLAGRIHGVVTVSEESVLLASCAVLLLARLLGLGLVRFCCDGISSPTGGSLRGDGE